jgi:hypothetical protein
MPFSSVALNQALDGVTVDRIQLHSGDPGAAGTTNALGTKVAATFAAAGSGQRLLSADVLVTGLSPNQAVTWFSIWLNTGTVFKGGFQITSGDTQANAAGEYTLKGTTTKLQAS